MHVVWLGREETHLPERRRGWLVWTQCFSRWSWTSPHSLSPCIFLQAGCCFSAPASVSHMPAGKDRIILYCIATVLTALCVLDTADTVLLFPPLATFKLLTLYSSCCQNTRPRQNVSAIWSDATNQNLRILKTSSFNKVTSGRSCCQTGMGMCWKCHY